MIKKYYPAESISDYNHACEPGFQQNISEYSVNLSSQQNLLISALSELSILDPKWNTEVNDKKIGLVGFFI